MVSFTDHYNAISIDRIPSKATIGKDSWNFNNSLLCNAEFFSAFLFFKKTQKTSTLQQVTGGNTPNLVLKKMLRSFLKIPPLKKILQFQDRICFFIKNRKTTTLQQVTGGELINLVLKRMLELFLNLPPLKKILKF